MCIAHNLKIICQFEHKLFIFIFIIIFTFISVFLVPPFFPDTGNIGWYLVILIQKKLVANESNIQY